MTKKEVLEMASDLGIKGAARMKKADVIRAIQAHEGNFPCFGTADGHCDQMDCLWRADCLQT
ncbi:MAG: Rho termination factor N-terminal domain-containing protein [Candidatus Fermentibacteraceae bacterium]|nr:Rho termination factor N-terminal domain-containing protein [Candidatus Fermentibacteraceae bacterium]MBN2608110.1 Rho termination factor N-terminal domain-containing protein [Candidatus Fermentibacteraceae bacterium]